jgi:hypothetical protein
MHLNVDSPTEQSINLFDRNVTYASGQHSKSWLHAGGVLVPKMTTMNVMKWLL